MHGPGVQFEDPEGNVVFEQQGQHTFDFHFDSAKEGEYKLCFTAKGSLEGGGGGTSEVLCQKNVQASVCLCACVLGVQGGRRCFKQELSPRVQPAGCHQGMCRQGLLLVRGCWLPACSSCAGVT